MGLNLNPRICLNLRGKRGWVSYLEWFSRFIEKNGIATVVCLLLLLDKVRFYDKVKKFIGRDSSEPHIHKRQEDEESHVHTRFDSLQRVAELSMGRIAQLENTMNITVLPHIDKEQEEHVEFGIMKNEIEHLKEAKEETHADIEKIYNLVSKLKDTLIDMGYGKK